MNTSFMTYIADIEASFLNYKEEVADSLNEAKKLSFRIQLVLEDRTAESLFALQQKK